MYSLIGLHDLASVAPDSEAARLFRDGLDSLRTFLPLFDTGSGSVYDLRHLQLRSAPNLARWDYHKVHVYLLRWLHLLTDDPLFQQFSDRWLGYSLGKRAKHN